MNRFRLHLRTTLAAAALLSALGPGRTLAQDAPQAASTISFNVPAGPLDEALMAFIAQSRVQIAFRTEAAAGQTSPGLKGQFTIEEGLRRILAGSTLVATTNPAGVVTLHTRGVRPLSAPRSAASESVPHTPTEAAPDPARALVWAQSSPAPPPAVVDEVVVTGSHLRGSGQTASPLLTLNREHLARGGRGTVAEALSDLPQVFNGSATPASNLTGVDRSGSNAIVAQGVNLRGLGAAATLVLVNGRRMAGAGLTGDFADVSAIPAAAVERVDVLLDGASALYGSDAVGGVVNIVLRQGFTGAESGLRLGGAEAGVLEAQAAHTLGRQWDQGHGLFSYEFHRSDALAAKDRAATASADLRPFGGTDRRQFYAAPGNIMQADPITGAYSPSWAIVPGLSGRAMVASDFSQTSVNLGDPREGADILPQQERHSLYGLIHHDFTSELKGHFEARHSRRDFSYATAGPVSLLTVTSANPFFVSPVGAERHQIAYDFTRELGPTRTRGRSESYGLNAGLEIGLGDSWRAEAYGAYAAEFSRRGEDQRLNSRFLQEALGAIADDPATSFVAARDGYFNPFGDGTANSAAVLAFIGSGFSRTVYDSQISTFNLQADGQVISLPGGPLRAAIGIQQRHERFLVRSTSAVSRAASSVRTEGPYERTVEAAFLELRAPLISEDPGRIGLTRLELTAAGRLERHSDVGESRTPKVGLLWAPHNDVLVRASYGSSFRAPALPQVFEPQDAGPAILPEGDLQQLVLLRVGGNLDLKPERARTWSLGLDFAPSRWTGWRLSLGAFQIDFDDQIGRPVAEDIYNALTDASYRPFVRLIDPTRSEDIAAVVALLNTSPSASPDLFPPGAYSAIVDARQVNTGGLLVRGVDFDARGRFNLGEPQLDLRLNGVWLSDYAREVTPQSPAVDLVGRAGYPPRLKGQASVDWRRQDVSFGLSLNYVSGAKDVAGRAVSSWSTMDARATWRAPSSGLLAGLNLVLTVRNVFDTPPPFYDNPQGVAYDPTNADVMGRFAALQLTKHW